MSKENQMAYWAAVRTDVHTFVRQAFMTVYPDREYEDNWHIHAILHALRLAFEGKQQRLIINVPPRALKSFTTSVMWPAFVLGQDPSAKIVCVSYSEDLGKVFARDFRRIVTSEWYRAVFPHVKFDKSTETESVTDKGGGRFTISVGGSLTGRGADMIIVDDPLKPEDALSDKARKANNDWYKTTLLSRLDDKSHSALVVVMQRLHVNDLTGFIGGTGYKKLSFPAIAVKDEVIDIGEGLQHHRKVGDVLQPAREGLEVLKSLRAQMGEDVFLAQYQQQPATPDGALFKRSYFALAPKIEHYHHSHAWWISIDTASSVSETADYSSMTYGVTTGIGPIHYIVKTMRGRWLYEELLQRVLDLAGDPGKIKLIVEYAGVGIALYHALRKMGYTVFYHQPTDSKIVRAAKILPVLAAGRVKILDRVGKNAWIEPCLNELMSFPHGQFDDQVDSIIYGISLGIKLAGYGDVSPGLKLVGG